MKSGIDRQSDEKGIVVLKTVAVVKGVAVFPHSYLELGKRYYGYAILAKGGKWLFFETLDAVEEVLIFNVDSKWNLHIPGYDSPLKLMSIKKALISLLLEEDSVPYLILFSPTAKAQLHIT